MQDRFNPDRTACFHLLFRPRETKALAAASWRDLVAAANDPKHWLVHGWLDHDRARLFAVVTLCAHYYPHQARVPDRLDHTVDVVRRFAARTAELTMRTIWVVCIDASGGVTHDVLLQMGGHPTQPPPIAGFLRQAVLKSAASLYVVDYRPLEALAPLGDTAEALHNLTVAAEAIAVVVLDWVVLGPNGALAMRECVPALRLRQAEKSASQLDSGLPRMR